MGSSFHSSLIVIRKLSFFFCLFVLSAVLREIVFALAPNSSSTASSVLLIRFAIFRALDVYSTDCANIVLSQRPSLVRSKSRAHGDGYLNILLIQLRDAIVGIITVYLTMNCRRPYRQSEGLLFHYVPGARLVYCEHTLCFAGVRQTQWRCRQLVEVLAIRRWPATDTIHSVFPLFVALRHVNLRVAL